MYRVVEASVSELSNCPHCVQLVLPHLHSCIQLLNRNVQEGGLLGSRGDHKRMGGGRGQWVDMINVLYTYKNFSN